MLANHSNSVVQAPSNKLRFRRSTKVVLVSFRADDFCLCQRRGYIPFDSARHTLFWHDFAQRGIIQAMRISCLVLRLALVRVAAFTIGHGRTAA